MNDQANDTPTGLDVEEACLARLPDRGRYGRWTTQWPLYLPWLDDANLVPDMEDVELLSVNDRPRLYYLAALARQAAAGGGAMAECGVFRGGSALVIAQVISSSPRRLYLIDSFAGLSTPDPRRDISYAVGQYAFRDVRSVAALMSPFDACIVQGWIPEVLAELPETDWSFVHVDVDLYEPTSGACRYFYDRLIAGGIMLFDEYGFPSCRGERRAVDEFFTSRPESPVVLPTGQAFIVKAARAG
jgi:O-methyltransferase